jgi:sugar phosphate permease
MVQASLFTYTVLYLMDARNFELLQATFSLTLMSAGGIIGRVIWGIASDRLFHGSRKVVLQLLISIIFAIAFILGLDISLPPSMLIGIFFVLGVSAIGWNGVFHAFIGELSGKEMAGLATGLSMTIVFMGGMVGPLLVGKIVDTFNSYGPAWFFLSAAMAGAFWGFSRIREEGRP